MIPDGFFKGKVFKPVYQGKKNETKQNNNKKQNPTKIKRTSEKLPTEHKGWGGTGGL